MAIILETAYPGRSNPASSDYPYGSIKNKSAPELDDGTPLDQQWGNDLEGFFQSLLSAAGITPSGTPDRVGDSQRFNALTMLIRRLGTPVGGIIMWSGSIASIPAGWALCNGASGTPDLRNRFVIGAGSTHAPGATGGSTTSSASGAHGHTMAGAGGHSHGITVNNTTLSVAQMPSHRHYSQAQRAMNSGWNGTNFSDKTETNGLGTLHTSYEGGGNAHGHGASSSSVNNHVHGLGNAGDHVHTVVPPYYALAYIMKLAEG